MDLTKKYIDLKKASKKRTFNSFLASDIKVMLDGKVFGNAQSASIKNTIGYESVERNRPFGIMPSTIEPLYDHLNNFQPIIAVPSTLGMDPLNLDNLRSLLFEGGDSDGNDRTLQRDS